MTTCLGRPGHGKCLHLVAVHRAVGARSPPAAQFSGSIVETRPATDGARPTKSPLATYTRRNRRLYRRRDEQNRAPIKSLPGPYYGRRLHHFGWKTKQKKNQRRHLQDRPSVGARWWRLRRQLQPPLAARIFSSLELSLVRTFRMTRKDDLFACTGSHPSIPMPRRRPTPALCRIRRRHVAECDRPFQARPERINDVPNVGAVTVS